MKIFDKKFIWISTLSREREGEGESVDGSRYAENNVNRINKLKYWISGESYTNFMIFNVFDKQHEKVKKSNNWKMDIKMMMKAI